MSQELLVGDFIVDSTYIYEIVEMKPVKNGSSDEETYMYYKPVGDADKHFTASMPVKNMKRAGARKVLSLKEVDQVFNDLKNSKGVNEYNTISAKEEVYLNNPTGLVSVLVFYWKSVETLTRVDKELVDKTLAHLCQEIALVTKKGFTSVKSEVSGILEKRVKTVTEA
jgi:RNA polymerase-interacting CarD/CdnL/TRCF family regulator